MKIRERLKDGYGFSAVFRSVCGSEYCGDAPVQQEISANLDFDRREFVVQLSTASVCNDNIDSESTTLIGRANKARSVLGYTILQPSAVYGGDRSYVIRTGTLRSALHINQVIQIRIRPNPLGRIKISVIFIPRGTGFATVNNWTLVVAHGIYSAVLFRVILTSFCYGLMPPAVGFSHSCGFYGHHSFPSHST